MSHLRISEDDDEKVIPAQLVLLAMGFLGVAKEGLVEQLGLETDERNRIVRNADFSTGTPGVFVAGDSGRGQSLIVWAIAEGRWPLRAWITTCAGRALFPPQ